MKKIILINIIFIFILTIVGELFLGSWFKKNNFGIHMRGHLNAKFKVESVGASKNNIKKEFIFFRNSLGFRNYEIEAKDIDAVFLGGSTTIQSYLPYEETIVGLLNSLFKENDISIVNAGLEGKSTYGYLCDFKYWFSKIEDLKPKYFIFYTGYNDTWNTSNSSMMDCEKITSRTSTLHKSIDYLINNSFILASIIKLKHYFFEEKITFDARTYGSNHNENNKAKYTSYLDAKKILQNEEITEVQKNKILRYQDNLNELKKVILEKNIKPIFITQIDSAGNHNKILYRINEVTKKFALKNSFILIRLDEEIILNPDDFYDDVHSNQIGSAKIARYIYSKLKNFF